MKINNMGDIRDVLIETLEKLDSGEIDIAKAGIIAKVVEGINSGLKTQLEYARLRQQEPEIAFLSDTTQKELSHSDELRRLENVESKIDLLTEDVADLYLTDAEHE